MKLVAARIGLGQNVALFYLAPLDEFDIVASDTTVCVIILPPVAFDFSDPDAKPYVRYFVPALTFFSLRCPDSLLRDFCYLLSY